MSNNNNYNFERDYNRLLITTGTPLNLSSQLSQEVVNGGLERYDQLYSYFWHLIDENKVNCQSCQTQTCYNRYFLIELKKAKLSENDLYLLTYMTTYFLDLITHRGVTLLQAYYILSRGHDDVFSFILNGRSFPKSIEKDNIIDNYQGYLLGVLYYMLPNFKYKLTN